MKERKRYKKGASKGKRTCLPHRGRCRCRNAAAAVGVVKVEKSYPLPTLPLNNKGRHKKEGGRGGDAHPYTGEARREPLIHRKRSPFPRGGRQEAIPPKSPLKAAEPR